VKIPYELRIFSVIILSTFLSFSFSHFGVNAFEGIVSKAKSFPENTWIATVNVSGLEELEASQQLSAKVSEWQTNSNIKLTYQEVSVNFPLSEIIFQVDESIGSAMGSSNNKLIVRIEEDSLQQALTSLSPNFSTNLINIDVLKQDLLTKAAMLQTDNLDINVENYLLKTVLKNQIVHSVSIPITNADLQNIGATLEIEPKATFSVLSFLDKQGLMGLDSTIIDLVSSGIYQAILSTDFKILERHIGNKLPENIQLGYEAKVDSMLKWDLTFYNPNDDSYKIDIYSNGESLIFDVVGPAFLYQYTINETEKQQLKPQIIKQFSPLLNPGQSKITRTGQYGSYIEISRVITDESNSVIEDQLVSKDYYPPVHQIEVFGLGTNQSVTPNVDASLKEKPTDTSNEFEPTEQPDDVIDATGVIDLPEEEDSLWGRQDETGK
jgi:hypothetical protein